MRIGIVVIVALALTLSGSTSVVAGAATAPTPGRQWQTSTPAAAGLNADKLEQIASTARAGKSRCLVVARDGKLAGEWYFRGTGRTTAQDVFSVTKSVTSILVGHRPATTAISHRRSRSEVDHRSGGARSPRPSPCATC